MYSLNCHKLTCTSEKWMQEPFGLFHMQFQKAGVDVRATDLTECCKRRWGPQTGTAMCSVKEKNISHEHFGKEGVVFKLFHFAFLQ